MHGLRVMSIATVWLALATAVRSAAASPADDQYAVAAAHYRSQRWQLAADEFASFLKQFPDDGRGSTALFLWAESLLQLERYEDAEARYGEYVRSAPRHVHVPQAQFRLGETALLLGRRDEARQKLEAFHREQPQDPLNAYALAYLGDIALGEGDGPRAEAVYREAVERFPQGPMARECRLGLARALELQGEFPEAARFYRFLADNAEGPLADEARLRIGVLLHKQGQQEEAAKALDALAAKLARGNLRAEARYWAGLAQLALARDDAAARSFSSALEEAPDHALAAAMEFSWGESLRKQGKASEAETHYGRVLERWPESPWADDALQVLAELAFDRRDDARVERCARQFAEKHADSPLRSRVEQTLGRTLLRQGRYQEAVARFSSLSKGSPPADAGESSEKTPAEQDSFSRQNVYYLGLAHLGAGNYEQSLAALDQVRPQPQDGELAAGVHVARASALLALKRFADAVEPLRAYLASHPQGPDAAECTARLAVALAETGDFDEAEKAWTALEEKHATCPLFLPTTHYLAHRAQAQGKLDLARRLFTALAENKSSPEYAAKGLAGLGKLQLESGQAEDSSHTFEKLLAQAPERSQAAEAALLRARALEAEKRHDAALTAYRLVWEQFADSGQAPSAMLDAARLHERLGQRSEACDLLRRLTADFPRFPQMDAALYQFAWLLADLGKGKESAAAFGRLAAEFAGTRYGADAAYRLAERAAEQRDDARAHELLEQVLRAQCEPELQAHALYLKGKIAADRGTWPEVLPPMQRLLEEHPGSSLRLPAGYWIAEAYYRLEKYDEAEKALILLAEESCDRQDPWLAAIPLRRAQLLAQRGQWQEAYEMAAAIANRFPDFRQQHEVDYLLGRCLSSQGRFAEARRAYERVVRSPTGSHTETAAMAQWMVGESYLHQKEYDQAIRAYHRVVSLYDYPRWQAAALLQAGKCHERKGETAEALRLYAQLLKDHPATTFAADAAERLKTLRITGQESGGQRR